MIHAKFMRISSPSPPTSPPPIPPPMVPHPIPSSSFPPPPSLPCSPPTFPPSPLLPSPSHPSPHDSCMTHGAAAWEDFLASLHALRNLRVKIDDHLCGTTPGTGEPMEVEVRCTPHKAGSVLRIEKTAAHSGKCTGDASGCVITLCGVQVFGTLTKKPHPKATKKPAPRPPPSDPNAGKDGEGYDLDRSRKKPFCVKKGEAQFVAGDLPKEYEFFFLIFVYVTFCSTSDNNARAMIGVLAPR